MTGGDRQDQLLRQPLTWHLAGNAVAVDDQAAIAEMHQLIQFGGVEQHRTAARGELLDHAIDALLGPDIDAPGRIEQQQAACTGDKRSGKHRLLLIAAGQRRDTERQIPSRQVNRRRHPLHQPTFDATPKHTEPAGLPDHRQRYIRRGRQVLEDSLGLAFLWNQHDAGRHAAK